MKKSAGEILAELLQVHEAQRLHLRLMELASFNRFDGPKVVKDLLAHCNLWQACLMDRESFTTPKQIKNSGQRHTINLIKLRDMDRATFKRIGSTNNVNTLFILTTFDAKERDALVLMAQQWDPDEINFVSYPEVASLLGGAPKKTRILRLKWD